MARIFRLSTKAPSTLGRRNSKTPFKPALRFSVDGKLFENDNNVIFLPTNQTQIVAFSNFSGVVWTKTFDAFSERNLRFQFYRGSVDGLIFRVDSQVAKVKETISWVIMLTINVPARSRLKDKTSHSI